MAKKRPTRKPARPAKKPARKPARPMARKKPPVKKPPRPAAPKTPWFKDGSAKPLISEYAQRTKPFIDALADGRIDDGELQAQESRLIAAMKDVEPLLNVALHEKVTRLLCEMAAYDLMQTLHGLQPTAASEFHG